MGSNDLAPCLLLAVLLLRFIYFFFAPHSLRLPTLEENEKKMRAPLALLGWIISLLLQMSSNFATSERKIGARWQSQTHISLCLVIICAEFC